MYKINIFHVGHHFSSGLTLCKDMQSPHVVGLPKKHFPADLPLWFFCLNHNVFHHTDHSGITIFTLSLVVSSILSLFAVISGPSRPLTRYSDAARTLLSRPERQRRPRLAWVKRDGEAGGSRGRRSSQVPGQNSGGREGESGRDGERGRHGEGEIDGERDRIQWRCWCRKYLQLVGSCEIISPFWSVLGHW